VKHPILDNIRKDLTAKLINACDYCAVADSDDFTMLSSGKGEDNLIITLRNGPSPSPEKLDVAVRGIKAAVKKLDATGMLAVSDVFADLKRLITKLEA